MSTLANITSLNLSLQTGGAALAVKSAKRLVAPSRTVYVYAGADGLPPNFTTPADALTYALSLDPSTDEPVVITSFANADGTPVNWGAYNIYALAQQGIFVRSSFDPWERYVVYGGVLNERDLVFNIDESQLSVIVQG
jgi:hypothetical protein